ncbi:M10 family metallopeptidase [Mesorhizobium sp. LHD-90]|uniref:M10 family metallopeptidase n=1 Tax=Mesorhizobium sp. LHD-90 TaxID=3071414 RepID=UPI0027E01CB2|nr:M10 family metallopeptidase [Mesorhizobium sp. LHD-90]MDQ6433543.1 M10 family metallopeptidase [Mesorhizobium sp. LHD-90]
MRALPPDGPVANGTNDPVTANVASGVQRIDGLLGPRRWSDGSVSYSDPDAVSDYGAGHPEPFANFSQLSAQQMVAVHFALNTGIQTQPSGAVGFSVEGFTGLNVSYAGTGVGAATLRYANTSNPSTAYAYFPNTANYGGDAFFGPAGDLPTAGNYDWHTIIHETGHALGLKHGHETGDFGALPANRDSLEYTVMTYRTFIGDDTRGYNYETWSAPQTFMMDDIAALQHMYGADYSTNSGDTVYSWDATTGETYVDGNLAIDPGANRIFQTIWDGGGNDAYDLSNYATDLFVSLTPGGYSTFSSDQRAYLGGGPNGGFARGNVFNAFMYKNNPASLIENVIGGSGADNINGNRAANRLDGGANADTMTGRLGDDTYLVDNWADAVVEAIDEGIDVVLASASWVLSAGAEIEFLETASQTDATAIDLTGNAFSQTIVGNAGINVLKGGGGLDTLSGLDGNDIYLVYKATDVIQESSTQGADRIGAGTSYVLAADVHVEHMATTSVAGTRPINLTGNEIGQRMNGNAGANRLEGKGGNDTLKGLGGADTFVFASKLGDGNVDTILDFSVPDDRMLLSDAIFAALNTGTLASAAFRTNTTGLSSDASDRIIYETDTGRIFYDADGTAAAVGVHFVTITAGLALTNADFSVA